MIKYRTSLYNIYIELVKKKEHVLIINGYTGEYIVVQKKLVVFLKEHLHFYVEENVFISGDNKYILSPGEVKSLKRKGIVTAKPEKVERNFFKGLVNNFHQTTKAATVKYFFLISYACNFNCEYCYQKPIKENLTPDEFNKRISKELVDSIIKAIPSLEKEKHVNRSENILRKIFFYGGEPFLLDNREMVDYIISEFDKTGKVEYFAISNGYELEHYADLLGENKISGIQIALDGFESSHNNRRNVADINENSFQKICNNISMALEKSVKIHLRLNTDKTNIHSFAHLFTEIKKRGWHNSDCFSLAVAPIALPCTDDRIKTTYNLTTLFDEIKNLSRNNKHYEKLKFGEDKILEKLSEYFDRGRSINDFFHATFCNGQTNMLMFDPFGDVYGCLEKGADPGCAIGKIDDNGSFVLNHTYKNDWESRMVVSNQTCAKCGYALFCGGGCARRAEEQNGTIHSNYCNGFKGFFNRKVAEVFENKEKYVGQSESI